MLSWRRDKKIQVLYEPSILVPIFKHFLLQNITFLQFKKISRKLLKTAHVSLRIFSFLKIKILF